MLKSESQIYLDNTATSWPKPPEVINAISDYLTNYGASPGRSGHKLALKAARMVFDTRELISDFFNTGASERVIFTPNATYATNIVFNGILKKGDHVVTSHLEHNSTHRPLRHLERQGIIELSIFDCDHNLRPSPERLTKHIKDNTKLVSVIHGSNVLGTVSPIDEIAEICRNRDILLHVDAAQTAGFLPIDMQSQNIDILTFTGHKKMFGPSGIGGICINANINIDTLIHGGSGSNSENDYHPLIYPDKLEAGTPNSVGITGLKAGLEFILKTGQNKIIKHTGDLSRYFIDKLSEIDEIKIYADGSNQSQIGVISITSQNYRPDELASLLDKEYGIMTRAGLHCSPLAHKAAGTFPQGTLRFSPGYFNTEKEISYTIEALKQILIKS
jgi:cysteine desulfurase / selenocysteine lyase